MISNADNTETNKLTPVMRKILELLLDNPKTDLKLIETIPDFPLEILGKLRKSEMIDHNNNLVYITSKGEKLLNDTKSS